MPRESFAASTFVDLAREMKSFISDHSRGGDEIADMIGRLGQVGEVAIFGGMPRDIARAGHEGFDSDVDLVVDACPKALESLFGDGRAERNRFGGYRVRGRRHTFDVWALTETWASRHGHVHLESLTDLVHSTFFSCDAVVYLCSSHTIHGDPSYAAWLRGEPVDLNLEANPNPSGAIARAERIVAEWGETLAPRLTACVQRWAADRHAEPTTRPIRPTREGDLKGGWQRIAYPAT